MQKTRTLMYCLYTYQTFVFCLTASSVMDSVLKVASVKMERPLQRYVSIYTTRCPSQSACQSPWRKQHWFRWPRPSASGPPLTSARRGNHIQSKGKEETERRRKNRKKGLLNEKGETVQTCRTYFSPHVNGVRGNRQTWSHTVTPTQRL